MIDPNASAFPSHGTMGEVVQEGLTIRARFAAMMMAGLCANSELLTELARACKGSNALANEALSLMAREKADALIAELNKEAQ